MGNSAEDFKEGRIERYRDRLQINVTDIYPSQYYSSSPPTNPTRRYAGGDLSRCVDTSHPTFNSFQRLRKKHRHLRKLDIGGPLCIEKSRISVPNVGHWSQPFFSARRGVVGVWAPTVTYKQAMLDMAKGYAPAMPAELGIDRGSLRALGSTAIAKSIPDIPDFSLFRFLGELREGLPKVPLKALLKEKKLRSVGDEYLNYQFGIAPTIGDLEKLFKALNNPALRSAVKHTLNEEHRVRKTLEKDSQTTRRVLTSTEMNSIEGLTGASGTLTTYSEHQIWSSISFVYYQANMLDKLITEFDQRLGGLGVFPNAVDLWNLTAWSWLVDWFVNFNHVITSLSYLGKNGLSMQRGYLMAHYLTRQEFRVTGSIFGNNATTVGFITNERKYRVAASPFGFGYTWKDFSPFQLSILGSLGVSRLRF